MKWVDKVLNRLTATATKKYTRIIAEQEAQINHQQKAIKQLSTDFTEMRVAVKELLGKMERRSEE